MLATGIGIVTAHLASAATTDASLLLDDGTPAGVVLYYPLHNYNSDLCLGISGGVSTAGAQAIQWTCNFSKTQAWGFPNASNGYVFAKNLLNQCLDVAGASKVAGAKVESWPCNGGTNQQWYPKVIRSYPFVYNLINRSSGMCLDVKGASKSAGAIVEQWPCNGGTNQEWFLTRGTA
jgi:hypothetical protein